LTLQVGKKPAEKWLEEQLEALGEMPRIKSLGLPGIRNKLIAAEGSLKDYCSTLDTLEFPVDFAVERQRFLNLVAKFEEAWQLCQRVKNSLLQTAQDCAQTDMKLKQDWRNIRDKYRKYFVEKGTVPAAIAKNIADALFSKARLPASVGLKQEYQRPVCTLSETSGRKSLLEPFMLEPYVDDGSGNTCGALYFRKLFTDFHKDNAASVKAKNAECDAAMRLPTSTLQCIFGSIAPKPLELNPPWAKGGDGHEEVWFQHVPDLRHLIYTYVADNCDATLEAWPWRHTALFLTQHIGRSVVVLLDAEQASKIQTTHDWLHKLKSDELAKNYTWLLEEGSTLWCPFGTIPVVVGINSKMDILDEAGPNIKPRKKETRSESACIGLTPIFDSCFAIKYNSKDVIRNVLACAQLAEGVKTLGSWKSSSGVQNYSDSLRDFLKTEDAKSIIE
jgi:hypothetical protein